MPSGNPAPRVWPAGDARAQSSGATSGETPVHGMRRSAHLPQGPGRRRDASVRRLRRARPRGRSRDDRHGVRPGMPLDPYLQLLDTSGNVLAEDDDGGTQKCLQSRSVQSRFTHRRRTSTRSERPATRSLPTTRWTTTPKTRSVMRRGDGASRRDTRRSRNQHASGRHDGQVRRARVGRAPVVMPNE
jgi:hypothetical protein